MSDCLNCSEYDKEKHFCPKWCNVIKSTIEDAREDERAKTINEVIKAMCDDCKKEPCYGNECKHYKVLRQMKGGAE